MWNACIFPLLMEVSSYPLEVVDVSKRIAEDQMDPMESTFCPSLHINIALNIPVQEKQNKTMTHKRFGCN